MSLTELFSCFLPIYFQQNIIISKGSKCRRNDCIKSLTFWHLGEVYLRGCHGEFALVFYPQFYFATIERLKMHKPHKG